MTTKIRQKQTTDREPSTHPIAEIIHEANILATQGKSQDEIERLLGFAPGSAPFQVKSRRKPRQDPTARDPTPTEAQSPPVIIPYSEITASPIRWLWPGRIPLGTLTVLDGDPGIGKSLISIDLAARVTTARPMPDGTRSDLPGPAGALILSGEEGHGNIIRPRLAAARADITHAAPLPEIKTPSGKVMANITDLNHIRACIQIFNARLLVIDPLMSFLPSTVNSFRDQDIRSVLGPLIALVAELEVALLVIRHLNKTFMANALYRGGGSIGIIGAARSGLLVAFDPDDPTKKRRILAATKANLAALPPAIAYYTEVTPEKVAFISWGETTDHTASTLLAQSGDEGAHSALEDATAFLLDALADGSISANVLHREAAQTGISRRALFQAKGQLGIKARKTGQPGQRNQQWVWTLPPTVSVLPTNGGNHGPNGKGNGDEH